MVSPYVACCRLAVAGGTRCRGLRWGAGLGRAVRPGSAGYPGLRVGHRRGVAPHPHPRLDPARQAHPRNSHSAPLGLLGPLDPACLADGRLSVALCAHRRESRRHPGIPVFERAPWAGGQCGRRQEGRRESQQPSKNACQRLRAGGGAVTTDRLVTPFPCPTAQSGPRQVSLLNFVGSSGSIQRLCAARPSDLRSRGRA